jgi:hypothetical protein
VISIYDQIGKMDEMQLRMVAERMAEMLLSEAGRLDRWAIEAQLGGWSDYHLDSIQPRSMVKQAAKIRQGMLAIGIEA